MAAMEQCINEMKKAVLASDRCEKIFVITKLLSICGASNIKKRRKKKSKQKKEQAKKEEAITLSQIIWKCKSF
ncbi:MAG: hypothetical protein Q8P67_27465 [archaeon]|nr:hypothetical protein [archaeon]